MKTPPYTHPALESLHSLRQAFRPWIYNKMNMIRHNAIKVNAPKGLFLQFFDFNDYLSIHLR